MEKEKRKGRPRRRWLIVSVLSGMLLLVAGSFWAWSYYISPGHSLSEFSRFESEEEVVAFLHDNFDLYVTTSDDILMFMDDYPLQGDGCRDNTPTAAHFANYVLDEDITNIISCSVPVWTGMPGIRSYTLYFYINKDDLLEYISAYWFCACI